MKKMIILAMSCISTLVITDATAMSMFTRLRQPAQQLRSTTPGRTRAFSTITTTQSRAVNDAEEALKKLKYYKEDLVELGKRNEERSSQNLKSLNEMPWYKRYLPNLGATRTEKYQAIAVTNTRADIAESAAKNLSKIESEFTKALEELKKELAEKNEQIIRLRSENEKNEKEWREQFMKRIGAEIELRKSKITPLEDLYPTSENVSKPEDQKRFLEMPTLYE